MGIILSTALLYAISPIEYGFTTKMMNGIELDH